jgi:hypothetical protein
VVLHKGGLIDAIVLDIQEPSHFDTPILFKTRSQRLTARNKAICATYIRITRRHVDIIPELQLSLLVVLPRRELDYQTVFHGEHGVVVEVLAGFVEDLGGYGFVAFY